MIMTGMETNLLKNKVTTSARGGNLYKSCHISNLEYNDTSLCLEKFYRKQESEKICTLCGFNFSSVL